MSRLEAQGRADPRPVDCLVTTGRPASSLLHSECVVRTANEDLAPVQLLEMTFQAQVGIAHTQQLGVDVECTIRRLLPQGLGVLGSIEANRVGAKHRPCDAAADGYRDVFWPKGGDARKSATDDEAAQIYVTFPRFPAAVRSRIISYIWDTTAPVGSVFKSEKTGLVTYIVVRSGPTDLGKWLTESRNVLDDYKKIFGEAPGEDVGAISIAIGLPLRLIGAWSRERNIRCGDWLRVTPWRLSRW